MHALRAAQLCIPWEHSDERTGFKAFKGYAIFYVDFLHEKDDPQ